MKNEGRVEDKEVLCPSCTRFVGTYEACPYCGAQVFKRLSVRFFRWGSLAVAIIGLFLLWIAARGIDAPLIQVEDLTATMTMGQIRIEGALIGEPSIHPEWNSLYVGLDDGTGVVNLSAFDPVSFQIMEAFQPARGDIVSAQGMVRVQQGSRPRLQVQSVRHFRIIRRAPGREAPTVVSSADVTVEMEGERIVVAGRLTRTQVLHFGAFRAVLEDESGELTVWIRPNSWERFPAAEKALLTEGSHVSIRGRVGIYEDPRANEVVLQILPDGRAGCVVPVADADADADQGQGGSGER